MGMTELYISTYIEWVNHNIGFTTGTFSYMNNLRHNVLWASLFAIYVHTKYFKVGGIGYAYITLTYLNCSETSL